MRVTFFQVKTDQEKRGKIIQLCEEYFDKKEPLLIRVPHEKALEYVDLLLWRAPPDSFLPHALKDVPCKDLIVLTTSKENPNASHSLLNLCPEPEDNSKGLFTKIYELEDLSSTQKNQTAQLRYHHYKKGGFQIITI